MSGVDGGSKLNILNAPSIKKTEAELSASSFVVKKTKPKKQVLTDDEPKIESESVLDSNESNDTEIVNGEEIEAQTQTAKTDEPIKDDLTENNIQEDIVDTLELEPILSDGFTAKKRGKKIDIKADFVIVKDVVFTMYEKVFNNTLSFKPTYKETIADLILYLSKKLSIKNANERFDLEFGLTEISVPDKYSNGYIPLCLKLSKWCKENASINVCEDLLFSITSLYLNSANLNGLTVTELELTTDFEEEIEYSL